MTDFLEMYRLYAILLCGFLLIGCTSSPYRIGPQGVQKREYFVPFDQVWNAVQVVMSDYALLVNDREAGRLETEALLVSRSKWRSPQSAFNRHKAPRNAKYQMILQVLPIYMGRPAVQLVVTKQAQHKRDFFSDPSPIQSDGLEELSLLYRIDKEVGLQRKIENLNKRNEESEANEDEMASAWHLSRVGEKTIC